MALLSHEGLSGARSSSTTTSTVEKGSFIPHERDNKDEIIANFLKHATGGSVLYPNEQPTPTGSDLSSENPILTVDFINSPSTRRPLNDFLEISVKQTMDERERRQKKVFPRSATIFRRPQASLRRA